MKRNKSINELSEILADVQKNRPDLKQGIQTLLGGGKTPPTKRLTRKEWIEYWKGEFTRLAIKEKMKSS